MQKGDLHTLFINSYELYSKWIWVSQPAGKTSQEVHMSAEWIKGKKSAVLQSTRQVIYFIIFTLCQSALTLLLVMQTAPLLHKNRPNTKGLCKCWVFIVFILHIYSCSLCLDPSYCSLTSENTDFKHWWKLDLSSESVFTCLKISKHLHSKNLHDGQCMLIFYRKRSDRLHGKSNYCSYGYRCSV